jgi:hypothetical protein
MMCTGAFLLVNDVACTDSSYSEIAESLDNHLNGCGSLLSGVDTFEARSLLTCFREWARRAEKSDTPQRFDWYDYIFLSCGFYTARRIPLAGLDIQNISSRNVKLEGEDIGVHRTGQSTGESDTAIQVSRITELPDPEIPWFVQSLPFHLVPTNLLPYLFDCQSFRDKSWLFYGEAREDG